ncbi:hypothetical protein PoB_007396300 [Plakobranchus ocellatus]|uniref:Uncharacterized protein n=1 Tax=Plakobranchus ocellatus TaxID=259542 RepID=A0AAV4DT00_9GAST|nr:hypothetical protein PoB_007396300 [Plakobranchus ocellatus]
MSPSIAEASQRVQYVLQTEEYLHSNTFTELLLRSVLLMSPYVIMCKDLESNPSRGLWRLLKERPMLKLHRQKLMLRDMPTLVDLT